jgi:hypothetical protein
MWFKPPDYGPAAAAHELFLQDSLPQRMISLVNKAAWYKFIVCASSMPLGGNSTLMWRIDKESR